jgi:hypothetical protein
MEKAIWLGGAALFKLLLLRDNEREGDTMEGVVKWGAWLLLLPLAAQADRLNNEWYTTTRAESMGNVGIASAEDPSTAAFFNPAAIARTKKTVVEFANIQMEAGTGDFALTGNSGSLGKNLNLNKLDPYLQKHPNTPSYAGAAMYPSVQTQNLNFGILAEGQGGSYYDTNSGKIVYNSRYLFMPSLGMAATFWGGRLRIGAAVRAISITENDTSVATTSSQAIGYTVNPQQGFGVGLDAGALFTPIWAGLPTLGFVARNVGDTSFPTAAPVGMGVGHPTAHGLVKKSYDGGFSVTPRTGRTSSVTLAADYRDMFNDLGISKLRRINAGMEISAFRILYLRGGISRGYWTGGFGVSSKYGSFDLGSYAEELDPVSFRAHPDRRYSLRYGSRF